MQKKLFILLAIAGLIFLYQFITRPTGSAASDVINPKEDPVQQELAPEDLSPITMSSGDYKWTITPKAEYEIAARVLSSERYRTGWQSKLSPMDLALGWGELADEKVDQWVSWSQMGRFYFYRWESDSPYQQEQIGRQSANVHILPATNNIRRAVLKLDHDDFVLLAGNLVNVDGVRGARTFWWHTSLSRTDTGEGSCELLYLKKLVWDGKEYR